MTREEANKILPILQAFAEGKIIECRTKPSSLKGSDTLKEWTEMGEIEFWNNTEYRIKPKYRSFKNIEECWQEMLKHQPFGWIKPTADSIPGKFMIINSIRINELSITSGIDFTYDELLKYYTFADGTPFGIKVEE